MSWAVLARVLPAVALLPLGGLLPRLALGGAVAWFLSTRLPPPPLFAWPLLVGEVLLGATLGVLASLPAHAAEALRGDGPAPLGFAGRVLAWAVFFTAGGPALWLLGLGAGFRALPPAAWPDLQALVAGGGALFYGALVLGLPAWLANGLAGPLSAWLDRVGVAGFGARSLQALRPALLLFGLVALLPVLLDEVRGLWIAALSP